jgi:predicted nucleotidyltransferase
MDGDEEKVRIGTTDPSLALIVGRLIAAFHPEKVYLFGSHARGEAGPDSDYDLMLIMPDDAPSQLLDPRTACQVLGGTGIAADVLLWRRSSFERRRHLRASLPATIEAEGKILYAA